MVNPTTDPCGFVARCFCGKTARMLLELIDIAKRYDSPVSPSARRRSGASRGAVCDDPDAGLVLRGISLKVEAGASLAIVGPSGSGKSTLLNIIGTLDRPSAGRVLFEGRDLATLDDDALALLRNRRIGWVFQNHYLLAPLSALENVLAPVLAHADRPDEPAVRRAGELLERVGLGHRRHHRPDQLSGGERQRVALARALINQPSLLLADEPTGSLDHAAAESLAALLVELNRDQGVTLLTVTHWPQLAGRMAQVLELRDGRLVPQTP
jgi:lipoprotein-releasing system ATP-binding protein